MSIKLVALDLDRTTLNAQGKLSDANREAILKAMDNGVHICIASGRAFDTLPADVINVPGIEYAITSNGAAVYRIRDKQCLRSYLLTSEAVRQILDLTQDEPVAYEAFIRGKAYAGADYVNDPVAYGATEQAIPYIQATREPVEDIRQFILEHNHELDSLDIVVGDEARKKKLMNQMREQVNDVYLTSSVKQLIEVSYKDAGKKSGVKFLAEQLGINREEIAAFGDADNDMDMIEYAGVGIAMENATTHLKIASDHVTLSHDQDGVAFAMHEYLHIYE